MKIPAKKLLPVLIGLCSLGCSKTMPVYEYGCPQPNIPALPLLLEEKPLEAPQNIEILMYRDDILRSYIKALQETVICYSMKKE